MLVRLLLLLLLFLCGCGTPSVSTDAGTMETDTGHSCSVAFALEGVGPLRPGDTATLRVRITPPAEGVEVRYGLVGNARDASLGSTRGVTDTLGEASVELTAPSSAASFRVRASARCGNDAYLDLVTSDRGTGALSVVAAYRDARQPERLTVALYRARSCAEATGDEPERSAVLPPAGGTVQFTTLPAGLEYVVRGAALGRAGIELATGCAGPILVEADRVASARMVFTDLPLVLGPTYDLALALDLSATTERTAAAWVEPVDAAVSTAGGEAVFLGNAVANAIERVDGAAARSVFVRVFAESLADALDASLARREVRVVDVFRRLAGEATTSLATARASSGFSPAAGNPSALSALEPTVFLLDPGTPDVRRDDVTFTVERGGFARVGRAAGDAFTVSLEGLPLPHARLGRVALDALLARLGVTSADEFVALSVCPLLPSVVRGATGSCGDACVLQACQEGLAALGDRFDAAVDSENRAHTQADLGFTGVARVEAGSRTVVRVEGPAAGVFVGAPDHPVRAVATLSARSGSP